jgi:hypothetical protein
MRSKILLSLLVLHFFSACNNSEKEPDAPSSENDLDAARNFIHSALQSDFQKARNYMLPDTVNEQYISAIERIYLKPEDKQGLRDASINIHDVKQPNDSTTIVIYSNSYKKNHDTLKVLRTGGKWLVDLKYLFQHDSDTLYQRNQTDTIK